MFVDPYQLRHALRDGISITAAGAVQLSAGTTSSARADFTFSNSPSVTFGLNGVGVITASVAPAAGGLTNIKVSAGILSQLRSDITFNNSNGVSFGLAAGIITATVATNYQSQGAYLTTAALSQDSSKYAGTGFTTATTAGTNIVGTLATNGLSMGVPAYLTTAGAGTGISAINVSAGTTSSNVSAITFSNGSGVSFGFDGSNITASVDSQSTQASSIFLSGNTSLTSSGSLNGTSLILRADGLVSLAVSSNSVVISGPASTIFQYLSNTSNITSNAINTNQSSGFAGTGFTTASTTGSDIVGTLATNGLSMGVPAFLTNATAAFPRLDQVLDPNADKVFNMGSFNVEFQYAGGGTFSTNATRQGLFQLDFLGNAGAGAHGLHVLQSVGNQVDMHLVHIEGHDTNVLPFHIEGSHSNNMWLNQPINFTTDETAYPIGSVPFIMGTQMSNMVSNLNADYVDGREGSALAGTGFTTATTAGTAVVGTLGTNGLSMGVPAFATSSGAAPVAVTLSQFNNLPLFPAGAAIQQVTASQVVIVPFTLPQPISCSFVRFFISASWQQPAAVSGTSINTSWNLNRSYTFPIVILTQGQGASSNSLMYSTSTFCTFVNSIVVTAGAVGSNYTVSMTANFPQSGATTGSFVTAIATTSASYVLPTGVFTSVAGPRMLDIPFELSLNAGNYWMQIAGFSTDSAGNGPGNYSSASMVPFNWYAAQQAVSTWNPFGSASSSSNCFPFGLGSWSTNSALMSTSNINVTAISAFTDGRMIYFQMLRRA